MNSKKYEFTVVERFDGWEVLVDGEGGTFRVVGTREEAEAMAKKWRDYLSAQHDEAQQ